jgi:hypothetical protein
MRSRLAASHEMRVRTRAVGGSLVAKTPSSKSVGLGRGSVCEVFLGPRFCVIDFLVGLFRGSRVASVFLSRHFRFF